LVEHPFDIAPEPPPAVAKPPSDTPATGGAAVPPTGGGPTERTTSSFPVSRDTATLSQVSTSHATPPPADRGLQDLHPNEVKIRLASWTESPPDAGCRDVRRRDGQAQLATWTASQPGVDRPEARQRDLALARQRKLELNIPSRVPGSEAPLIALPTERQAMQREIDRIYPELAPLPVEPKAHPGPEGKPYTLADFQRMAAANSPTLLQAAADVEAARGNLIQAKTYPNPTSTYLNDPTDVNNTAGTIGNSLEQTIVTGGKLKLSAASAQKAVDNAVLALKRARSDLSTAVRRAYFTVLVDIETLYVTRALVQFSDDIYRLQIGLLRAQQAAPYEPTALLAQTSINRLGYKQAIASYMYDWKALVATLGLPQLPLSEIAGQVDRFVPYYDYDEVRAYALQNHTDVLTARNGVKIAQYSLKLAQLTPIVPNLDLYLALERNKAVAPFGTYQENTLGLPLPVWDQNKGNIVAAQGALVRAAEESHRVEVTLTNNLALAYEGYRNNVYAIEYYRRNILPDLVRYYRGVFDRRQIDPSSAFGDLVFAQQNLATNVSAYIELLGSLWSSVVGVADFLQTDDLYQLGKRRELPELPDFSRPPAWACGHDTVAHLTADKRPLESARVRLASWSGSQPPFGSMEPTQPKLRLEISPRIPGSEAPKISLPPGITPAERERAEREIERVFPELPSMPVEPKVQPGPGGKPYTLADFQRMAAANSPALRQAASDVEAAKGNVIQAMTYPNPTGTYMQVSSNNTNTAMAVGGMVDQSIIMGGKQKLGSASAQKSLDNAVLALKRARSDLSTAVRNAYFTVLVDVETLVVTRALVQFSDDIYRLQIGLLKGILASEYEPTALRAQTFSNRLAYKQAIASYVYDWKALVATLGMPQLPLSEIEGRVDRFIPYYDYDEVRAYTLKHHTDVMTARNGVRIAQYNLKLAQVTPVFPDLDVTLWMNRDFANPPHGTYQDMRLGFPLPIWDQNKGNIIAAQAALVRAGEESHRVEVNLTNSLALAYEGYRNNLYAMEYYRRNVLPDLVRYYRGIFARRQLDPTSAFGDLVFAQQNLSTNVTAYIGILGSLWSSVVSVADFLQTDDLYQLGKKHELPELPDFTQRPVWACGHDTLAASCADTKGVSGPSLSPAAAGRSGSAPTGAVPPAPAGTEAGPRSPPVPSEARAAGFGPANGSVQSRPGAEDNHAGRNL
jgi:cobalt-zinc-cadmium efflux system outer membrane protein